MVPDSYLIEALERLHREFGVDIEPARQLSGEALANWLNDAERLLLANLMKPDTEGK